MLGSVGSRACWLGTHVNNKNNNAENDNSKKKEQHNNDAADAASFIHPIPEAVQKQANNSLVEGASKTVISCSCRKAVNKKTKLLHLSLMVRAFQAYLLVSVEAEAIDIAAETAGVLGSASHILLVVS